MANPLLVSEQIGALPDRHHAKGIEIKYISLRELMVIAFTVTRICGAAALHIATGSQMRMAIDCFQGTIFNWCDAVSANYEEPTDQGKERTD